MEMEAPRWAKMQAFFRMVHLPNVSIFKIVQNGPQNAHWSNAFRPILI